MRYMASIPSIAGSWGRVPVALVKFHMLLVQQETAYYYYFYKLGLLSGVIIFFLHLMYCKFLRTCVSLKKSQGI